MAADIINAEIKEYVRSISTGALRHIFECSWSHKTSCDPDGWKHVYGCNSYGQCVPTALVLHDIFGGKIIDGNVNEWPHYWVEVDDGNGNFTKHDPSINQFLHMHGRIMIGNKHAEVSRYDLYDLQYYNIGASGHVLYERLKKRFIKNIQKEIMEGRPLR